MYNNDEYKILWLYVAMLYLVCVHIVNDDITYNG